MFDLSKKVFILSKSYIKLKLKIFYFQNKISFLWFMWGANYEKCLWLRKSNNTKLLSQLNISPREK